MAVDVAVVLIGFLLIGERLKTQTILAASTMAARRNMNVSTSALIDVLDLVIRDHMAAGVD